MANGCSIRLIGFTIISSIFADQVLGRDTYLRELLVRRHVDDAQLEAMLPDKWAVANPQHVLAHRLEESRTKAAAKRDEGHSPRLRTDAGRYGVAVRLPPHDHSVDESRAK